VQAREGSDPGAPVDARVEAPIVDQSQLWEQIGAAEFSRDGVAEGWETEDEKFIRVGLPGWGLGGRTARHC
jgi:hypothetical protein